MGYMETEAPQSALPLFPPPAPQNAIDPALQARLARLAAGRAPRDQPGATSRTTPAAAAPRRKRHAAKGSRAAAVLMSITTTAGLTAYFQHADSAAASTGTSSLSGVAVASGTAATTTASTAASTTASSSTASTTAATQTTVAAAAAATTATTTTLADGTYTGATSTNRWGPVQVQITVSGGVITQSVAIQTPTGGKSDGINARATPTLASEVLTAQSAKIDTVSGATYTSESYKASLQSAIDLARSTAAQAGATS